MVRIFIFFQFVFLLWTKIISSDIKPYTVNKCCPEGEIISFRNGNFSEYYCAEISGYAPDAENVSMDYSWSPIDTNSSINDYYWLPVDAIVNSTTLKIHNNDSERYLEILKENYEINAGYFPECGKNYRRERADFIEGFKEGFHLILFDNDSLRIHISIPDTLLDHEKDFVSFKRFNSSNEYEKARTKLDAGSLRTFPLTDTCFDSAEYEGYPFFVLLHCPCKYATCIRKCCADGEFFNVSTNHCELIPNTMDIQYWRPADLNGSDSEYYLLPSEMPSCKTISPLRKPEAYGKEDSCNSDYNESDNNFTIFRNGSAKIPRYKRPYLPDHYCGVATWHPNGIIYEQNLFLCHRNSANQNSEVQPLRFVLYGSLLILGGICLLITVSVSFFLPELKRRIHNKVALCHNFSLMIAYFAAGIVQFSDFNGTKSCLILGLVVQFSFLGSFFWLNVMCIDISMTFSATRSVGDKSSNAFTKKFIYYSIYAWGTTSIISIITIIMEFIPNVPYHDLKPGLTCNCGFDNDTSAILIYFYGPMAFTLALNLALFVFTMIKIMSIQRQTAILHKSESNATGGASYQSDKQRLILYAKLFLLMGLTWVTEIASWGIGGPDYYWYFSDAINLLRAVFIFILFICKKPVLGSLKRKLNGESSTFSNRTESSISTASARHSHSRFSTNSKPNKRKNLIMMNMDSRRKQLVAELSSSNLHKMRESRT